MLNVPPPLRAQFETGVRNKMAPTQHPESPARSRRGKSQRKDGVRAGVVCVMETAKGGVYCDVQQMQPADRWMPPNLVILYKSASRNAVELMLPKRGRMILWVEGKHE